MLSAGQQTNLTEVSFSHSRRKPRYYLEIGHDRFLRPPIISGSPFIVIFVTLKAKQLEQLIQRLNTIQEQ
jgi:hypothetical protein